MLDDFAALRVRPPDDPDVWKGREFFDDDPYTQIENNGLDVKDFTTTTEPWDLFPVAKNLTRIFDFCHEFVDAFIRRYYPNNDAVAKDAALQNWMRAAADPAQGNIRGLPKMDNPEALRRVLTSQIYRVTAHGISRLPRSADPWLTSCGGISRRYCNVTVASRPIRISARENCSNICLTLAQSLKFSNFITFLLLRSLSSH